MNLEKTIKNNLFGEMNLRQKTIIFTSLIIILLIIIVILSFVLSGSLKTDWGSRNLSPSLLHLFGTDWMGRDMLNRTIQGLGLSIIIGTVASIFSATIATILGLLSNVNKTLDSFVVWIIDIFLSIPHLLLIILVSIGLGGGALGVIAGVVVTHWTSLARVVRAEIKELNNADYIKVSGEMGKSKVWISKIHLLPHLIPKILVGTILLFPHAIMHEAAVTFLGFGLSPSQPAIGIILAESMRYLAVGYWWLAFFPGLALLLVVLGLDKIGENLNRLLDPKQSQQ